MASFKGHDSACNLILSVARRASEGRTAAAVVLEDAAQPRIRGRGAKRHGAPFLPSHMQQHDELRRPRGRCILNVADTQCRRDLQELQP